MSSNEQNWFAVYTKSRCEKMVDKSLQDQGYTTFLPLVSEKKQWSDRLKKIEIPLIKSYVFVKVKYKNLLFVLKTRGVVRVIKIGNEYTRIPEYQIDALRTVLEKKLAVTPEDYYKTGEEVMVTYGPLKGKIGKIIKVAGKSKLILTIDAINFAFSTPMLMEDVKKIEENPERKNK